MDTPLKIAGSVLSIGLVLSVFASPVVAAGSNVICTPGESQVAISALGQRQLSIQGTRLLYAEFDLSNRSGKAIKVFADHYATKFWVVHPHSVALERKDGGTWSRDVRSLSEYEGPNSKYTVSPNTAWHFYYSVQDLIINGASRTQQYRLVVTDADRCPYASEAFTLESLDRLGH
ncbi:hypothetical protein [Dyella silvae]|uniref:hypothetical protein n=1 Tax=Dyella silvae TaxID=2994424 RepID=UPI0022640153|nr:hypothetical protein [Dyella silvae]